jgi:hypothetical protein
LFPAAAGTGTEFLLPCFAPIAAARGLELVGAFPEKLTISARAGRYPATGSRIGLSHGG